MKNKATENHCYIYDKYNERGMKAFEKKINSLLRSNGIFENSTAHGAWMERGDGRGSYNKVIEISIGSRRTINGLDIDNESYTLKTRTTDSMMWDGFEATTKNRRDLFLAVLEENIEELKELLEEDLSVL